MPARACPPADTGINAATMALLLGNEAEARGVAAEVVTICQRERASWGSSPPSGAYWVLATLGEASLIAGRTDDAVKFYGLAVTVSPGNFVKLSSTKRQLALLLEYVEVDDGLLRDAAVKRTTLHRHSSQGGAVSLGKSGRRPSMASATEVDEVRVASMTPAMRLQRRMDAFDRLFNLPRVAVFISAEMHEGVLPAPGSQAVMAEQFDAVLQKVHAHFGYASPCTVADVVFLEAVKRRGGDIYIVLPVPLDVHLTACSKKFAEIEELTGEATGPFGASYMDKYKHVPVVAAMSKRLLEAQLPAESRRFTPEGVMVRDQGGGGSYGGCTVACDSTVANCHSSTFSLPPPQMSGHSSDDSSVSASGVESSGDFDVGGGGLRDSNLLRRLKAVIKAAARVDISNDLCPETSVTNRHYCSLILNGLAVSAVAEDAGRQAVRPIMPLPSPGHAREDARDDGGARLPHSQHPTRRPPRRAAAGRRGRGCGRRDGGQCAADAVRGGAAAAPSVGFLRRLRHGGLVDARGGCGCHCGSRG